MSCPLKIEGMPTLWDRMSEREKKRHKGPRIEVQIDKTIEFNQNKDDQKVEIKEINDLNIDIRQ